MKNIIKIAVVGLVFFIVSKSLENKASPYTSGAPLQSGTKGFTGSPRDNFKTCSTTGCHVGSTVVEKQGWITSNVPIGGYVEDSIYTITIQASDPNSFKMGFMASVQENSGGYSGTLFSTQNNEIQTIGGNKYVTHTSSGTGQGGSSVTWSFNWIAPSPSDIGTVTVYAAVNASNGNNSPLGDQIYLTSLEIPPFDNSEDFKVYPNPFKEKINVLSYVEIDEPITLKIFNTSGQMVYNTIEEIGFNQNLSIEDLPVMEDGVYFFQLAYDSEIIHKKLLKFE